MDKLIKSAALAVLLLLVTVTLAYAVSVNWGASPNPIYDQTGVGGTVLANGDIVQLIWDQGGDGIDPPDSVGNPTDDDQLLATSAIGVGSGFFPGTVVANINTNVIGVGNQIYVRAWNANSFAGATHYGNSPLAIVDSNFAFTFDATAAGSFATTLSKGQLAVTLTSFEAIYQGDRILLIWETASELDNRGFNLYRGTSPDGWDRQLNTALIPSQSQGNPGGFVYTWLDDVDLVPGTSYYYWLQDLDTSGALTMHGPVSVDYTGPTAVTLSGLQASPVADMATLPWLWIVLAAGAALGTSRMRR